MDLPMNGKCTSECYSSAFFNFFLYFHQFLQGIPCIFFLFIPPICTALLVEVMGCHKYITRASRVTISSWYAIESYTLVVCSLLSHIMRILYFFYLCLLYLKVACLTLDFYMCRLWICWVLACGMFGIVTLIRKSFGNYLSDVYKIVRC